MLKLLARWLAVLVLAGVPLLTALPALAVISSSAVTTTITGNGVTTVFTYNFIIPYQANGTTPAVQVSTTTGGVTTIIPSGSFSITGVGNPNGGTVTYPLAGTPLSASTTITIRRNLAYIQPTAVPNTTFYPHTVETVADNLDMQIQQLAQLVGSGGGGGGGGGVTSLNSQTGTVNILAGSGISVAAGGGNVTITNTGGGGGGGVTTFNTRSGAVTLNSTDVNTALGFTAQNCAAAGTGISVSCVGSVSTISATGGATQTVTQVANVTALRALTDASVPVVVMRNYTSVAGGGGGTFFYNSADTTTADNSCTIFVDAMSHRWYRQYTGPINVRWCGAIGDGTTDDKTAMQAALATLKPVYIPPSATCFITSGSLTVSHDQGIEGDSQYTSCIKANSAAVPIIIAPIHNDATNNNMFIRNLTLDRSIAATAGGDGIFFASYANNVLIDQMVVQNQYNGISLHSTDSSNINNSFLTQNYGHGLYVVSSLWYPTFQWSMKDVFSTGNEGDGFRWTTVMGAGSASTGTLTNLRTFSNQGYGISFFGASASDPLQGVRLIGGFFGEDGKDEIYADTYNTGSGTLVLEPTYTELAGTSTTGRANAHAASHIGSGIYLSSNVGPAEVRCGSCNQNSFDGLTSFASSLNVSGGNYTNNGQGSTAGRHNGIYIAGGNARGTSIGAIQAGNTVGNTTQLYGIVRDAGAGDNVAVAGANLLNNTTLYTTGLAVANSVIAGSIPAAANTAAAGACALTGCTMTGPLIVNAQITGSGDILTATSHATTAAITNLNVLGSATVNGGVTAQDLAAMRSLGVGTGASGTAGRIDSTSLVTSGAISASGAINSSSNIGGNSISSTTYVNANTDVSGATLHVSGASALHGTTIISGGIAVTGGAVIDNAAVSGGVSVGSATGGILGAGTVNAATSVNLNAVPYTNP